MAQLAHPGRVNGGSLVGVRVPDVPVYYDTVDRVVFERVPTPDARPARYSRYPLDDGEVLADYLTTVDETAGWESLTSFGRACLVASEEMIDPDVVEVDPETVSVVG